MSLGLLGCASRDPRQELEISEVETHWAIDHSVGETHYLAPVVRFRVRNKGTRPHGSIQATATFRRAGEEAVTWGSDWKQVSQSARPLAPGQAVPVLLKSDARYYSTGVPEAMFEHERFKDAKVEVFLRLGSSSWTKFAASDVERRIGARSVAGVR